MVECEIQMLFRWKIVNSRRKGFIGTKEFRVYFRVYS